MKRLSYLGLLVLAICLSALGLQAQEGRHHRGHRPPMANVEMLKSELNLTDEQVTQLNTLNESTNAKLDALRAQENEDKEGQRAAFRQVMEEHRTQMQTILTEEQHQQLKALHQERREQHRANFDKVDHKAMREEMRTFHKEKVWPVIRAERTKLEAKLSAEDKRTLAELRTKLKADHPRADHPRPEGKPGEWDKEKLKADREARKQAREQWRTEHAADFEQLNRLVEKYDAELEAAQQALAANEASWQAGRKAIAEKYRPEGAPERREKMGKERHRGPGWGDQAPEDKADRRKARFLLMDPNAPAPAEAVRPDQENRTRAIGVYPNPANNATTLSFEQVTAGELRIELRNEAGEVVRTIRRDRFDAGKHQLQVDLQGLSSGVYYLTLTDESGTRTERIVVTK